MEFQEKDRMPVWVVPEGELHLAQVVGLDWSEVEQMIEAQRINGWMITISHVVKTAEGYDIGYYRDRVSVEGDR
jgi:hypothetical protein